MSTEPLTKAGRSLFARLWAVNDYSTASSIIAGVQGDIVEIEREAALTAVTPLRQAARAAQDWLNGADVPHVDTALATLDAARAAQGVAGREEEPTLEYQARRIVSNGPTWARQYGYEVLKDALDRQPVTPPPDRLFAAVRRVIVDGYDAPGVHAELHAAFYEARDVTPPPDALREARERLEALLPGTLADDRDIAAALDALEAALHAQGVVQSPETLALAAFLERHKDDDPDMFGPDYNILLNEIRALTPVDESRDPVDGTA